MESAVATKARQAHVGIDKGTNAVQFTVPHGTTFADAIRSLAKSDLSAIDKLPRGCSPCLSGLLFRIKEDFDPVINVSLEQGLGR